jgi:hypothetical protein
VTLRRSDGTREELPVVWPAGVPDADRHVVPMRAWAAQVRDAVSEGRPRAPSFADGLACDVVLDRLRAAPRRSALSATPRGG